MVVSDKNQRIEGTTRVFLRPLVVPKDVNRSGRPDQPQVLSRSPFALPDGNVVSANVNFLFPADCERVTVFSVS
jgi:hypothetical protein